MTRSREKIVILFKSIALRGYKRIPLTIFELFLKSLQLMIESIKSRGNFAHSFINYNFCSSRLTLLLRNNFRMVYLREISWHPPIFVSSRWWNRLWWVMTIRRLLLHSHWILHRSICRNIYLRLCLLSLIATVLIFNTAYEGSGCFLLDHISVIICSLLHIFQCII